MSGSLKPKTKGKANEYFNRLVYSNCNEYGRGNNPSGRDGLERRCNALNAYRAYHLSRCFILCWFGTHYRNFIMSVLIGWFIVIIVSMIWLAILVAESGWKDTSLNFLLFFIGLELINGGTL